MIVIRQPLRLFANEVPMKNFMIVSDGGKLYPMNMILSASAIAYEASCYAFLIIGILYSFIIDGGTITGMYPSGIVTFLPVARGICFILMPLSL